MHPITDALATLGARFNVILDPHDHCVYQNAYGDWRERTERFQVQIEQVGLASWTGTFGERPIVDEDNEMKLYWGWVFAWDRRSVPLTKGPAKITLRSTTKEAQPRQVDVLLPDDRLQVEQNSVRCEVQAGGVRIIELN